MAAGSFAPVRAAREPITGREWLVVAVLTIAACALRAWRLDLAGLSQFDEGVYAFSALGLTDPSQPHRLFPDQQKFSPPVYFSLVAMSYLLGGASDRSAIVVNVIIGALTVPVVWAVARRWAGSAAAVIAATMVALAQSQIVLSRSALTDITFACVFFLALAAVAAMLERGGIGRAVVAGLAVGLAWNTKYHGWFALVIGGMAIVARWRFERAPVTWVRTAIRDLGVAGVVAVACYLPWAVFIQTQSGSTTGWAAYFATMLRIDWFGNLGRYAQQQWMLEGPWSRASLGVGLAAAALAAPRGVRERWSFAGAVLAAALGAALGAAGSAVVLSLVALKGRWGRPMPMGLWCLAALVLLWFVMAPLYQPYFRLLVPFSIATFILAGDALARLRSPAVRSTTVVPAYAALAAALAWGMSLLLPGAANPWRETRDLANVAASIDARVPVGEPLPVIGEPSLAFYLHRRGHASFDRATLKELDESTRPVYFVAGYYTRKAPVLVDGLRERQQHLELVGRWPMAASDLRLLDDYPPDRVHAYREQPDSMYDVLLYRYTPPGPSVGAAPGVP